jgi:protein SCO1
MNPDCIRASAVRILAGLLALLAAVAAASAPTPDAAAPAATVAKAPLPADSVYQLALTLTDQQGRALPLGAGRGHPVLVSMFYTSCQFVCPMLVEALRATEARLSAAERARVTVLLVSIDPEHDSVAVLERTARQRELDTMRWSLARTDAASVRKLAAVLGIQYRALANGEFNHSTALILLDNEGRIVARTAQLGDADPIFVRRVKASLAALP